IGWIQIHNPMTQKRKCLRKKGSDGFIAESAQSYLVGANRWLKRGWAFLRIFPITQAGVMPGNCKSKWKCVAWVQTPGKGSPNPSMRNLNAFSTDPSLEFFLVLSYVMPESCQTTPLRCGKCGGELCSQFCHLVQMHIEVLPI